MNTPTIDPKIFQAQILRWFDANGRALPWRKNGRRNPHHVWLSEIMLQQTTVQAVIPYYKTFLSLYPDVEALAAAPDEEVLKHWAGLGYYSRARNLIKCARVVTDELGGKFPEDEKGLLALPGIGPYSAAAIAAIAFQKPAAVVDGNIERVLSRIYCVETPLPKSKPELKDLAKGLTPLNRPGDYAESLMDLGAMVCKPKTPLCGECPVSTMCYAKAKGLQADLPKREAKKPIPTRRGAVFWLENEGKVLIRRRPNKGLLGGMPEFPTTPWVESPPDYRDHEPAKLNWQRLEGEVRHTFTHFHLVLEVYKGEGEGGPGKWVTRADLKDTGFPTVMKKVLDLVEGA